MTCVQLDPYQKMCSHLRYRQPNDRDNPFEAYSLEFCSSSRLRLVLKLNRPSTTKTRQKESYLPGTLTRDHYSFAPPTITIRTLN
jgi:hypothetical protein